MAQSTMFLLLSLPFALAGIAGNHMVQRRRFYRRNQAGIEEFRSYGNKVATTAFEGVLTVASRLCFAAALGLAGIFAIVRLTEGQGLVPQGANRLGPKSAFSFTASPGATPDVTDELAPGTSGAAVHDRARAKRKQDSSTSHQLGR